MADIIDLDQMRPLPGDVRAQIRNRRKMIAVREQICADRYRNCEKCGARIDGNSKGQLKHPNLRVPYRFCPYCSEEYIDYIERLKGRGDSECYWRNADWLESWRRWIDYQGALDRFARSKEFARLLKELQESTP